MGFRTICMGFRTICMGFRTGDETFGGGNTAARASGDRNDDDCTAGGRAVSNLTTYRSCGALIRLFVVFCRYNC